ncbi:hypothetical protein [Silvanigrella aquatica]|uniref:indole-3-glycerol-phosphate synthase n=1 Tax=Silvanigrella aquatica TaxID=1915309 RepID=A0A1L4D2H7_9BACT|nr:hypothetical protein [Silvanigrella aquatica]APJ04400.1 hypothetical protein AXG55_10975 [Silvanigrella aquatica]
MFFQKKNLLSFFLEQQKKLTLLNSNYFSLSDKRQLAENIFLRNKTKYNLNHKIENKKYTLIPNYIHDKDFCSLFDTEVNIIDFNNKDDIFCLFTSPLHEEWLEKISIKHEDSLVLRSGFFTQEYEIYDSIIHGFDGMFIYCYNLDKYQIQYLTEIGREFHFSIIFIIHNKKELQTVLDTDAPYIAISGYNPHNFSHDSSIFFQLANLLPKTTNLMAWAGLLENSKKTLLNNIGFKVIFEAR